MKLGHGIIVGVAASLLAWAVIVHVTPEPACVAQKPSPAPEQPGIAVALPEPPDGIDSTYTTLSDLVRVVSASTDTIIPSEDSQLTIDYVNAGGTVVTLPRPKPKKVFRCRMRAMAGTVTVLSHDALIDGIPQVVIAEGGCKEMRWRRDHYEAFGCLYRHDDEQ